MAIPSLFNNTRSQSLLKGLTRNSLPIAIIGREGVAFGLNGRDGDAEKLSESVIGVSGACLVGAGDPFLLSAASSLDSLDFEAEPERRTPGGGVTPFARVCGGSW